MTDQEFKYDVGFSFLQEDEQLAFQINDLIKDRLNTFFYSERQKEIAGKDGEQEFNKVFAEESRIVVVLYRAKWGSTKWTRIEETAIRNRAFDHGYDFVTFIPMEKPPAVPRWLPKNRLWVNYERWGIEVAAGVIESRVLEAGGVAHEETIEEKAARLAKEEDAQEKRKSFLISIEGVNSATAEYELIRENLEGLINKISSSESSLKIWGRKDRWGYAIFSNQFSLTVNWRCPYYNSLDTSSLKIILWKGAPPLGHGINGEPLSKHSFNFDIAPSGDKYWRGNNKNYSTVKFSEFCLDMLMNEMRKSYLDK